MARKTNQARKQATTKTKTRVYDTANYLRDEQDMAGYLEAALMGGDAAVITAALSDIARAKIRNQSSSHSRGRFSKSDWQVL
jgi:DNA-binding phage protein